MKYALIPVGVKGYTAKVDMEDHTRVLEHRWWISKGSRTLYARTRIKGKNVMLHAFITGESNLDHRNRNGLDCRKANLRKATHSQNAANAFAHKDNQCGLKGVW